MCGRRKYDRGLGIWMKFFGEGGIWYGVLVEYVKIGYIRGGRVF